jgi:uncharacterized phage-associated protein
MVSPQALSNSILYRAFSDDVSVTPMKLQKLLYFVYCEHLRRCGESLFSERFEVWKHGPVLPSVYNEFKSFGSQSIDRFAQDAKGLIFVANEDINPDLKTSLNLIWSLYSDKDGIELSQMTHEDGTAWSYAYDNGESFLSDEKIKEEGGLVARKC